MSEQDRVVRAQLLELLRGGHAHMPLDRSLADYPPEDMNRRAPNVTYTPWQLLEHIRIAQRDIIEFIRDPDYVSPRWPEGYWPTPGARADEEAWRRTVEGIRADRRALEAMLEDPDTDLYAPLPHGSGQTILREMLLVADHSGYHLGEFALMRQILDNWPDHR